MSLKTDQVNIEITLFEMKSIFIHFSSYFINILLQGNIYQFNLDSLYFMKIPGNIKFKYKIYIENWLVKPRFFSSNLHFIDELSVPFVIKGSGL